MPWRVIRGAALVVSIITGAGLRAWAQDAPAASGPPEAPPPAFVAPPPGYEPGQPAYGAPAAADPLPGFMTLDRMDSHSRAGLQVGWDKIDAVDVSDGFVMRYNLYGQFVFPGAAGGMYAQLPFTHLFDFNGPNATGTGNTELGGFYMPFRNSELILRAGLIAATASESGNEVFANVFSAYERLTDVLLIFPNYTTARLSASTFQQSGMAFFRADLGFDFVIDRPDTGASNPASVFFRANVGAGIRVPDAIDLTAELVNIATVNGDNESGIEERFIHTLALSLRTPGVNQFHFGTVFPLDEGPRGELWILSAGYQRAFP